MVNPMDLNRRKSQLFLTQISPVHDTHDEVVKKKLKRGKFPQTKTGIIKMISLCFELGGVISWLILEEGCTHLILSYLSLTCVSLSFSVQLIMFLIFSFGWTVHRPGTWINTDIGFNFLLSLLTIVVSSVSMKLCISSVLQRLSAILSIAGAVSSVCACGALFLLYRFVEDPDPSPELAAHTAQRQDPRKSLFA